MTREITGITVIFFADEDSIVTGHVVSARPSGTAATQEWQDASLRWRMVSAAPPGAAEPPPKEIGRGAAAAWMPWPGRHRLELVDARGQVLDSVQVEVRGAGVVASRAGGR